MKIYFFPLKDKLLELRRQLSQLNEGIHPEWTKKLKRLENAYKERLRINAIIRDLVSEIDIKKLTSFHNILLLLLEICMFL